MADERPSDEAANVADPHQPTPTTTRVSGGEVSSLGLDSETCMRVESNQEDNDFVVKMGDLVTRHPILVSALVRWTNTGATQTRRRILRHLCERERTASADDATYDSLRHATGLSTKRGIRNQLDALETTVRESFIDGDAAVSWLNDTEVADVDELVLTSSRSKRQPKQFRFVNRTVYEVAETVGSMAAVE